MPFTWVKEPSKQAPVQPGASSYAAGDAPYARLKLWPHKSLTPSGFVWFIGLTFALLLVPLVTLIGSPVLWGVMPFMLGTLAMIWIALRASWRSMDVMEELTLWSDHVQISHRIAKGGLQEWSANPHWVQVSLHPTGGPVSNYVTLRGAGREVELGAFLSDDERLVLYQQLQQFLAHLP